MAGGGICWKWQTGRRARMRLMDAVKKHVKFVNVREERKQQKNAGSDGVR